RVVFRLPVALVLGPWWSCTFAVGRCGQGPEALDNGRASARENQGLRTKDQGPNEMLLKRHFERLLLSPADLEPSRDDFEVVGVFNPGAIVAGDEVVLLVRVAERPRERRAGFTASPRWVPGAGPAIDWLPDDSIQVLDPRVVKRKADGLVR